MGGADMWRTLFKAGWRPIVEYMVEKDGQINERVESELPIQACQLCEEKLA